MKITLENVKELWELYEYYLDEFRKNNYSNIKPKHFENFVESEVTICSNCGRYVLVDNIGTSELAMQDNICEECLEMGYGE